MHTNTGAISHRIIDRRLCCVITFRLIQGNPAIGAAEVHWFSFGEMNMMQLHSNRAYHSALCCSSTSRNILSTFGWLSNFRNLAPPSLDSSGSVIDISQPLQHGLVGLMSTNGSLQTTLSRRGEKYVRHRKPATPSRQNSGIVVCKPTVAEYSTTHHNNAVGHGNLADHDKKENKEREKDRKEEISPPALW